MYYKIENEFYTASVDDMGAQLHSFCSKQGEEYLWQGNPDIWYGQAPVLFPFIGQLKNDKFIYNGKEYSCHKHGLARKLLFKVKSIEDSKVVFSLESDENTLKQYPFEFELLIAYELCGRKLKATHTVINKTDGKMYFSIGAHPGFNCEIGDVIEFEKPETLETQRIDSENLIIEQKFPVLDDSKEIVITKELFDNDALILSGIESEKLSIVSKNLGRKLEFVFGKAPYLGIWAKPAAPYVCIEPWYGVNDSHEDYGEVSNKVGIQSLEAGESFEFSWTAEVVSL